MIYNYDDIYVSDNTTQDFFLRAEYCKRYFEEFSSDEEFNFVVKIMQNLLSVYKEDEINECIYKYEKDKNGEEFLPTDGVKQVYIDKDTLKILYDISLKYKLLATELIHPIDMISVIRNIEKNSLKMPFIPPFGKELTYEDLFDRYGYKIKKDKNNTIYIEISFDDIHECQDGLIDRLTSDILNFKIHIGLNISDAEKKYIEDLSKIDKNNRYRTKSFYNRIISIYAWDIFKTLEYKNISNIKEKIVRDGLYKYNNKICDIKTCNSCESKDNCLKGFTNNYKIAVSSIKKGEIIPTSGKGEDYIPIKDRKFTRCELE